MDYIDLDGKPAEERCASTGKTEGADVLNKLECRAYIKALKKRYGEPPEGSRFSVHGNPHDFGTYYTVRFHFDKASREAVEYADKVADELNHWLDVNFWAPVSYNKASQLIHVIADLELLDRDQHPKPPYSQHAKLGLTPGEFV